MRGILRSPVESPHKASDAELWSFLCLPITFRATSSGSSEPLPSNSSHPLPSGSPHSLASDSSHSLASGSSHFLPKGSSKLPKGSSNLPPCGSLNILPSSSSSLKPIGNPNLPSDRPNLPSCLKILSNDRPKLRSGNMPSIGSRPQPKDWAQQVPPLPAENKKDEQGNKI